MEPITIGIGVAAAGALLWSKYGKATAKKAADAAASLATKRTVQQRVRDAIATGNPDKMDAEAKALLADGHDEAATSLSALAAQWRKDAAFQAAALEAMKATGAIAPGGADPTKLQPLPVKGEPKAEAKEDPSDSVRALAVRVEGHLRSAPQGKEDKKLVAAFQDAANRAKWTPQLKVDGLYGEGSRQALRYYLGGREVPPPRYGASKGTAYKPASASEGGRVDDRLYQAHAVVGAVTGKNKKTYNTSTRAVVAKFQAMMGIAPADGLYGKQTAAAVKSVGISNPPAPIY